MTGVIIPVSGVVPTLDLGTNNLVAAYPTVANRATRNKIAGWIEQFQALAEYASMDFFYLLAAPLEAGAYLNFMDFQKYTLSPQGGLTFAANQGITGDGSTGYLVSGLPLSKMKMSQDDAQIGAYVRTASTGADTNVAISVGTTAFIVPRNGSANVAVRLFQASTSAITYSGTKVGHIWVKRSSSAGITVRLQDGTQQTPTIASAAPSPASQATVLGNGSTAFGRNEISVVWGGKSDFDAETNLVSFIDALLTDVGAI